ncbi:DUF3467 domain-containing protein [Clostridiaceae bacterium UIB06]|uniref:DUF3467 domain-containing protein n=1 Tax=Clostridium thailandense TaxID=2794346 RepID=A0A949U0P3_9CLOT|nr:DUF3467 domain-containing protein [Clostridium thailandense]MBV7275200.1 DUF3467 domain-containing protein [Clostridium thailandense]MCH5136836.1 DUF3467 domain-containing protein [Clostridiaceae bacterium UIB06]
MEENIKLEEKELYSNRADIFVSVYDFQLDFMKVYKKDITDSVKIFMSPQQAKSMCNMLLKSIENYENTFGEININPKADV